MRLSLLMLLCVIIIPLSYAYSIGLSPDKIEFNKNEVSLIIFNPNNFVSNYSINGCNFNFIEFLRNGQINPNNKREIIIRYNSKLNKNITSCNLELFFGNNIYSTAFSIPITFTTINSNNNNSFFSNIFENNTEPQLEKEHLNIYTILIPFVIFIILLLIIIKFF